jgi:hypothetical protein
VPVVRFVDGLPRTLGRAAGTDHLAPGDIATIETQCPRRSVRVFNGAICFTRCVGRELRGVVRRIGGFRRLEFAGQGSGVCRDRGKTRGFLRGLRRGPDGSIETWLIEGCIAAADATNVTSAARAPAASPRSPSACASAADATAGPGGAAARSAGAGGSAGAGRGGTPSASAATCACTSRTAPTSAPGTAATATGTAAAATGTAAAAGTTATGTTAAATGTTAAATTAAAAFREGRVNRRLHRSREWRGEDHDEEQTHHEDTR